MDLGDAISSSIVPQGSSLSTETFAALIDAQHTEFIISHFSNNIAIIITQFEKLGNLYSVDVEQIGNGLLEDGPIYNIRALFGPDSIETEVGIRYISEKLDFKKPLLFSLTLKSYKTAHLNQIIEIIKDFKSK